MSDLDVVYVGDFRVRSDSLTRAVEEVLMNGHLGYRSGLAHIPSNDRDDGPILPEVLELIDHNLALSIDYEAPATADLIIILAPLTTLSVRPPLPVRISAEHVLAILDFPASVEMIAARNKRLIQHFGNVISWAATAYDALACVQESGVSALGTIWQPFGYIRPTPTRLMPGKVGRYLIGATAGAGAEHWPAEESAASAIWNTGKYRVRLMGDVVPPRGVLASDVLKPYERPPARFVSRLDAFVYYPDGRPRDLPLTAIGTCLAADIPVLVPPHLKPAIGKGPVYATPSAVGAALEAELPPHERSSTPRFNALEIHKRRMRFWLPKPSRAPQRPQRTALFVSSNGDGLGHVTRLLAIARKLGPDVAPVFASMSLGIGIIRDAGYHAELILSHRYAKLSEGMAYPWMGIELDEMLVRHSPDVVVFDGGYPYGYLLDTMAARRRQAFLWLRRGMWRPEQDNAAVLAKERLFDAVIEPSDLAGSWDKGATVARKEWSVAVDPIRLIDESEQLSRSEARAELGLNNDDPAVLIQLGPGNQRDVSMTLGRVASAFDKHPKVQLVNLNAPISRHPARNFARVKQVAIYPMARYLKAFDFALSAAGYNSFHELVTSQIPTIFIVTPRPELDDQEGRAGFAEAMGLGFALTEQDLTPLPGLVDRLLDDPLLRETLRRNCQRLKAPNGAKQVADLVAEFAR